MKCGRPSGSSAALLLLLFFFMALVMARADEPSEIPAQPPLPQSSENSASTGTLQTDPWESFDSAWSSLKLELMGWSEDSQTLYELLEALQTEAGGLRYSLTLSTEQYKASEEARMIERKAAEAKVVDAILRSIQAQKQMERWRTGAKVAIAVGAAGWILATVALIR